MNIDFKCISRHKENFKIVWLLFVLFLMASTVKAARLKDIATVKGVRENILIGYGIVVGLKGSGDSSTDVTSQSLSRLFGKLGLDVAENAKVKSKNAAAVIVTSKLPPFSRVGNRIDITVSSIGDAKSLEGGMLLVTPLRGGDQNVYAVAQGLVSVGGITDGSASFPTVGRVIEGATIEKDIESNFSDKKNFRLSLNQADFTSVARVVATINGELGGKFAQARDSGTIDVVVPFHYEGNSVELLALLENMHVNLDTKAKVILNERTGTVVMGQNVSILPVAISHGDLSIQVKEPTPQPQVTDRTPAAAGEPPKPANIMEIKNASNVSDLVKALNALGVKPKDMTAIFQTLRRIGALQAELEII